MKKPIIASALSLTLISGATLPDAEGAPVPGAGEAFQVTASEIYLGDGNRIENGVLVVEDGRISKVGRGVEIDPRLPLIEHDGVLTAGIVACAGQSGAGGEAFDSARSILPEGRVVHAFDPGHSDFARARKAGVTSILLAPTAQNLVGGRTCVVKTAGGRVLADGAHLSISFSKEALGHGPAQQTFFFGAPKGAAVDDGLERTGGSASGARYPTSYPGLLEALEAALAEGEGVFARVEGGSVPVLLEARERHETARAARFAIEHELTGAILGAPLAGEIVGVIRDSGLGVILGPFDVGQSQRSLAALPALSDAGVPFAFALGRQGTDPARMRLSAAMAVGAGVDPVAAWRALSSDAARLAGVGDRVGRLERGMDADFVLWSGDPIDLASRVVAVFVDGERVYGGER